MILKKLGAKLVKEKTLIMFDEEPKVWSVTAVIERLNGVMRGGLGEVLIEGEVMSFKISQGKWVFFDLKDESGSLNCFMPVWKLKMPIEDGMKVVVRAYPNLTDWGKFSLTVENIKLVGEGDLKKSFEILRKRLEKEGLFAPERKRSLPDKLVKLGVISSETAAGYADFVKIVNARWGGMEIYLAHTAVQGESAPEQIMRALRYFNEKNEVQAIAIIRGGGSVDDLACFNDEWLVRAVAESKIPIITGIGHEIDLSLVDLAADLMTSTPSNVAELITKDRQHEIAMVARRMSDLRWQIKQRAMEIENRFKHMKMRLMDADPNQVLKRGYAILRGEIDIGSVVKITTFDKIIKAEIKDVEQKG